MEAVKKITINKIKNAGVEIYDISTEDGNLEDVFIDVTKG